jgi:hypothetical protein
LWRHHSLWEWQHRHAEIKKINLIIESEGFQVNLSETRIKRRSSQQLVTGLVVNEIPNIPIALRKNIRAMFHQAYLYPKLFEHRENELWGTLAYYRSVRPQDARLLDRCERIIKLVRLAGKTNIKSYTNALPHSAIFNHLWRSLKANAIFDFQLALFSCTYLF